MNSPGSSPVRKRQRLSSPFDEFDQDINPDALRELEALEARFTQSQKAPHSQAFPLSQPVSDDAKRKRVLAIEEALSQATSSGEGSRGHSRNSSNGDNALLSSPKQALFAPARGVQRRAVAYNNPQSPIRRPSLFTPATFASAREVAEPTRAPVDERIDAPVGVIPSFSSASAMLAPGFDPASAMSSSGFGTASAAAATSFLTEFNQDVLASDFFPGFTSASVTAVTVPLAGSALTFASTSMLADLSFKTASKKNAFVLSGEAIKKAAQKLQQWEEEERQSDNSVPSSDAVPDAPAGPAFGFASSLFEPTRNALGAIDNLPDPPDTPSPPGSSAWDPLSVGKKPPSTSRGKTKAFKSPLLTVSTSRMYPSQNARAPHPLSFVPISASFAPTTPTLFRTPTATQRKEPILRKPPKPSFVTPFKKGLVPGEPRRDAQIFSQQQVQRTASTSSTAAVQSQPSAVQMEKRRANTSRRPRFFDLVSTEPRTSLLESGLYPGRHSTEYLDNLGINVSELQQITPDLGLYYSFRPLSSSFATASSTKLACDQLGSEAALQYLTSVGCSLATKAWVDNHWGLILWKLAGMACLDAEREGDPERKRWSWDEVIRQLLYRYERELNSGSRPSLRLVTTQDAPVSSPMVLCISNITWSEETLDEQGTVVPPNPELEVTDGWYRLRANVDESLARATRRGLVRVGMKLAISGARMESGKKEPCEVLDAYQSISLTICGNSTHLVPWHVKLGFSTERPLRSLGSLSPDGGTVSLLDLIVVKAHPVAFLEFKEDASGKKLREGPRGEKEEAAVSSRWMERRTREESVLRMNLEKQLSVLEGYAERCDRIAGRFQPSDNDEPPDTVDELYDELEDIAPQEASSLFKRVKPSEAGWLARLVRRECEKKRESASQEFESELNSLCPPREVRSFRVLLMQDARAVKRPAYRQVQLTIWDVMTLDFGEGHRAGTFVPGQRFMVSNLIPTQQTAWMNHHEEGSEVYLSTRRDTTWTRMKSL